MTTLVDDALQYIASVSGGRAGFDTVAAPLNQRLAQALGWQQRASTRLEIIEVPEIGLNLASGFLGPQRAAVFAADGPSGTREVLDDAALFAYHSSVHWGLVADSRSLVVFNSHRVIDDKWFRLPEIRWSELDQHQEVLQAFTPEGMAADRFEKLTGGEYAGIKLLAPVDDALVAGLELRRREALRFGRHDDNLDEDLHTLFSQFFVLRVVEDRKLKPGIPRLENVVTGQRVDARRLRALFRQAQQEIQSELFAIDNIDVFPDFILANIITDLYTPSQLPHGSQRYNFAWLDSDVLGRAYEKYLSNIFRPAPTPPQLRLFEQPERDIEAVSVKRSGGVFYTPSYIVGTLTEQAIDDVLMRHPEPDYIPRIGDFACGSGTFLVKAFGVLLRRPRERDAERDWVKEIIDGRYVIGIDIDLRAVTFSRMELWTRFTEERSALPLPSVSKLIVEGDSLGPEVWESLPTSYDIVVGNPPFIAMGNAPPREELRRRFQTARGRFDYSYLFVELAMERLSPGGVLGMVVPNRLFRNRDAGVIRGILTSKADLVGILDFGSNEVFAGTSAYIGAVFARKRGSTQTSLPALARVVLVSDVSDTRYLGGALAEALSRDGEFQTDALTSFDIPYPIGDTGWALLSPRARKARIRLEQESRRLNEVADVNQGIRTGANDIFIVQGVSADGPLMQIVNGIGDSALLESELLQPVVFGSDIQRYDFLRSDLINQFLLYPYRHGVVIPESTLVEDIPHTYSYMSRYRDLLSARSSVVSANQHWYEIVRRRDENWLSSCKLLSRDLATRTSFALDYEGQVFLVGGTAVVPADEQLVMPLLAYLNSATATEYLSEITPSFRGGFRKLEPQHLSRLPVPLTIAELGDTALELGQLALNAIHARADRDETRASEIEGQIDRIVAKAAGLD